MMSHEQLLKYRDHLSGAAYAQIVSDTEERDKELQTAIEVYETEERLFSHDHAIKISRCNLLSFYKPSRGRYIYRPCDDDR